MQTGSGAEAALLAATGWQMERATLRACAIMLRSLAWEVLMIKPRSEVARDMLALAEEFAGAADRPFPGEERPRLRLVR